MQTISPKKRLSRSFFRRSTLKVARDLLGKTLFYNGCAGIIKEVEAYIGENDPACHAARGKTARNEIMYGPAGFSYVYFIYGMYHCLNVVTERKGFPAAVLIRSVEPIRGIESMMKRRKVSSVGRLAAGPGMLCEAFGITRKQNGIDLTSEPTFGIQETPCSKGKIYTYPRIGIKEGTDLPWRFVLR